MTAETVIPVEDRIVQLLQHLGIQQTHFAARSSDWGGLANRYPEVFSSLTLLCPGVPSQDSIQHFGPRLLVYSMGDGEYAESIQRVVDRVNGATLVNLPDSAAWSDIVSEHLEEISAAMLPFLARTNHTEGGDFKLPDKKDGEVAGITYQIRGAGPPLVLLPIGLVPSQWEPLVPRLSDAYTTITLGGAELGITAVLEMRGRFPGYLGMVRNLFAEAELQPGESVLEVGCGTGILDRWLAKYTQGVNPIVGVDINAYLLREAAAFTRKEGLGETIEFREGNGESLPFPDNSFDVTFSVTVMEEVDAQQMLAEMIRVTKPGGRVAVIVRAIDRPFFINLPLPDDLKAKVEDHSWAAWVAERGCADASLYRLFHEAGLAGVKNFPYLAAFEGPSAREWLEGNIQTILNQDEGKVWQAARTQGEAEGTFFYSYPHHCAVGTKAVSGICSGNSNVN